MLSIDFKNTYDENCNNLLKLTTIPLNSNDDGRVQIRSDNFNSDMTCESNNLSIVKAAAIWRSAATRCNKFSNCDDNVSAAYINNRYRSGEVKIMRKGSINSGQIVTGNHNKSIRVAFEVILRFLVPLANGVVRGFKGIRDVRFLKFSRSIACSRQTLINLFAFAANTISMNLSVAQVSHRIEPILKLLKIKKSCDGTEILPTFSDEQMTPSNSPTISAIVPSLDLKFLLDPTLLPALLQLNRQKKTTVEEQIAPKCCTLQILAEPPPGQPIRADIIFIHGLHGSVVKTWRQGLWENERRPVQFDRPPRPPVRPPKRPRHSRTTIARPPHKKKRPRFAYTDNAKQFSDATTDSIDECDENFNNYGENMYPFSRNQTENVQICDGTEYSSPTFRLRMNDSSRLLQAELLEYLLNNENSAKPHEEYLSSNSSSNLKLDPNDPNYSKCWPGDWLPLDCPGVRVMAVDYTTDSYLWRPMWKNKETRTNLIQRSREMSELLIKYRVGHGHPIVYVGHSKGGLFVKEIIVHAWESGRPAMAPLWRSARGVFFYSVPHRGSHLASIKAPLLIRSVELIDIEKNSKYLLDLHRRFAGLYHLGHLKIEVFSFVETALTLMSLLYLRIVGVDSADPGIGDVCGIRLDHREICKPRSRDCILYKELVKMIKKVC